MEKPTVSILIPTLNASSVLGNCLESIKKQNYPAEKIEIIVADGGSSDGTVEIAKKYGAGDAWSKLKTGEAGKAAALRARDNALHRRDVDSVRAGPRPARRAGGRPLLEHEEA